MSFEAIVLESEHPYTLGCNSYSLVQVSGASAYSVSFDDRCCTVGPNDYFT